MPHVHIISVIVGNVCRVTGVLQRLQVNVLNNVFLTFQVVPQIINYDYWFSELTETTETKIL